MDSLDRIDSVYLTPNGSAATINGQYKDNWGLSIGTNLGITLEGFLHANNVNLTGDIQASSGRIGDIEITQTGLSSPNGLALTSNSLTLTKGNSSLSLGTGYAKPYIQFSREGAIQGPLDSEGKPTCGFVFSGTESQSTITFRAQAYRSGQYVYVYIEQNVDGKWYSADPYETNYNYGISISGLLQEVSFTVQTSGRNMPWFGDGTDFTETKTITIKPGSGIGSAKLSGDYDKDYGTRFISSNTTPTLTSGNVGTFTQTIVSAKAIKSIGSILPIATNGQVAIDSTLGAVDAQWHAIYAQQMHAVNGYFVGDLTANAAAGTTSDRKLKNTIKYDISKYDKVFDTLKPVSYKYNDSNSDRTHLGFIAQDVQEALQAAELTDKDYAIVTIEGEGFNATQGIVTDEEKTTYRIRYAELHALEVRQIQLLKQEVKELKAEIQELKSKITE